MISNRPYLLRAFHQWIIDSNCTPILIIDAQHPRCKIPQDYAEDGEIVFNISPSAVRDLKITNEVIEFKASFGGVIHIISAPIKSVLAIHAEENGEGIFFDAEEEDDDDEDSGNVEEIVQLKEIESSNSNMPTDILSRSDAVRAKPILKLVE